MLPQSRLTAEWLETDGLGGFSSGTVAGWRSRRYHGILTPAVQPPSGRAVLLAGFEARLETAEGLIPLSSNRYAPDTTYPDGVARLVAFEYQPWPTWTWQVGDRRIAQELFVPLGRSAVCLRWRLSRSRPGDRLVVRPFLGPRDSHSIHHENGDFRFDATVEGERVRWQPYPGLPPVVSVANGEYRQDPLWYRQFLLDEEKARGFEHQEDLASPGELSWDLAEEDATWLLYADGLAGTEQLNRGKSRTIVDRLRAQELRRRAAFPTPLHRAADAYIVARGEGKTVIAGYPWFTDWGRDTFIALRGLCLAGESPRRRAGDPRRSGPAPSPRACCRTASPTAGDAPEYNSVDASLWFVVAVHELLRGRRCRAGGARRRGDRAAAGRRRRRDPRRLRRAARATASAPTPTACSPPASPACSSPGWTPRSATGW